MSEIIEKVFSKDYGIGEIIKKEKNRISVYFISINKKLIFNNHKNEETNSTIKLKYSLKDVFKFKYISNQDYLINKKGENYLENLVHLDILKDIAISKKEELSKKELKEIEGNQKLLIEELIKDEINKENIPNIIELLLNLEKIKIKLIIEPNKDNKKKYREMVKEIEKRLLSELE